ncbi:putative U3 small nucleolar RNA-associated protein 17 [Triangularia verruculosa]|uniref:U3 small nucleolar RNA-associated protein 17 n=1 Tax=Triangularia verruculosa TaxID=2587418 RepID=A0AAN6XQ19_9PEZI|nr:putative U3 small nucleolar RNA-associated protein 17 [Triangularia verruculosa]
MRSKADTNGDTASLKKRKREPKDDSAQSQQKKHRRKSKQEKASAADGEGADHTAHTNDTSLQLINGHSGLSGVSSESQWKVQPPMGGRMLNIDPIFSPDEKFLIITYNTSIQVFSTESSLPIRRIPIPLTETDDENATTPAHIVATSLSMTAREYIWVASSDGRIWNINWRLGTGSDTPFTTDPDTLVDMSVNAIEIGSSKIDVLLALQKTTATSAQIAAYTRESLLEGKGKGLLLHSFDESPQMLRFAAAGRLIVAAAKSTLHIGKLRTNKITSLDTLQFDFHSFDLPDIISCLDVRPTWKDKKLGKADVVVGCARGAIYLYNDILSGLSDRSLQPRKLHWHRRAVHSVKWSKDGNYLISGGAETVLVLWQIDAGLNETLPHLSATIENITVSPRGASYAIHLDDNSTMILSTAEMKPTMFVSGIQSLVLEETPSKESLVRRVWRSADEISAPVVVTSNPRNPSQMFLCVGNGQQATQGSGTTVSAPLVQVFDLSSFQGIAKHAIARTNTTEANITKDGVPIMEPTATSLSFSPDGKWLASVDEWQPPERDTTPYLTGSRTPAEAARQRREIYLKFWEVHEDNSLELVTRVNEAHHSDLPQSIFDVASDPIASRFATIGNDGVVRFWSTQYRIRDGLAVKGHDGEPLRSWHCSRAVTLPVREKQEDIAEENRKVFHSGAVTYSEDGSILFAAYRVSTEGLVVAIDTQTGTIRDVISGIIRGEVRSIQSMGSCLILLSEDIAVYDTVSDELLYSYKLKDTSPAAKRLTQLAVNRQSRTFALAAPIPNPRQDKLKKGVRSELTIFSLEDQEPQLVQSFPHLITSVLAAPGSSGFVVVDSAAQIWAVTDAVEQPLILKSMDDLSMDDTVVAQAAKDALVLQEDESSDEEMEDADQIDIEVDDHAAVVATQHVVESFDVAPTFAFASLEGGFTQLATMWAMPPTTSE